MPELRSKVTGAVLGCAVGDAMGAPFEGLWGDSIPTRDSLLDDYHLYDGYPSGQFTDDTQLTVATVESIVRQQGIDLHDIAMRIAQLWHSHAVIGPGGACTHAAETFLITADWSTMGAPIGQAGNGTAMRTAVLGLWYLDRPEALAEEVADVSRLTHQDPRSVAGGVAIAEAARLLSDDQFVFEPTSFCEAISARCWEIEKGFAQQIRDLSLIAESHDAVQQIAFAGQSSPEFDRPIITPYVVPTVLASLYCVIKHPDSWSDAVTTAIRLGGDVDTLGAIVGALSGARLGEEAIPQHLLANVQRSKALRLLAAKYHAAIANSA